MCLQAPAPSPAQSSSLQTIDRVKNYKVVGQVSNYARDLAEHSTIYNYLAPMSHKGLAKVSPYVPDVSQYVPKKYVEKVDSLGVTCLKGFENVTTTSEEVLQRRMKGVTQYVHTLLPAKEPVEDKGEADEDKQALTLTAFPRRVYASVSTKATSIISPVSTKVTDVSTKVTTKVTGTFNDALCTVTTTLAPINSKVRQTLSYENFSEVAVASTSYGMTKASAAIKATKSTTLACVPERYRESVEGTVTKYEERAVELYKRLPTTEEIRNFDRQHAKAILGKAVTIGTSPLWSLVAKVKAPFTGAVPSTPTDEGATAFAETTSEKTVDAVTDDYASTSEHD